MYRAKEINEGVRLLFARTALTLSKVLTHSSLTYELASRFFGTNNFQNITTETLVISMVGLNIGLSAIGILINPDKKAAFEKEVAEHFSNLLVASLCSYMKIDNYLSRFIWNTGMTAMVNIGNFIANELRMDFELRITTYGIANSLFLLKMAQII